MRDFQVAGERAKPVCKLLLIDRAEQRQALDPFKLIFLSVMACNPLSITLIGEEAGQMKLRHRYQLKFGETEEAEPHVETSHAVMEHQDNLAGWDDARLVVPFERFGPGENPRNYEVDINWLDIKSLVRKFIEIGHPDALHLK